MSQGTQQMTMTHEEARQQLSSELAQEYGELKPVSAEQIVRWWEEDKRRRAQGFKDDNWSRLLLSLLHAFKDLANRDAQIAALKAAEPTAQTARVPTREEIAGIVYRVALRVLGTASAGTLRTLGHEIADALLHTPDTDATGGV